MNITLPTVMKEDTESVVLKASPDPLPELESFLQPFLRVFRRDRSRRSMERYVTGLLTDLMHKNCDTMAGAVVGTSGECLQHLLTDAKWDARELDELRVQKMIAESPPKGLLLLDDTGLLKKGSHSVGVARQYSGTAGKISNCQVVVSAEYAEDDPSQTRPMHWPITGQVYLPQSWTDDRERCGKAHVPDAVTFRTKPEIALDLVDQARAWGVPFEVVVADAGYGDNPSFLDGLEQRKLRYVCGVEGTFGLRVPDEVRAAEEAPPPAYPGRGQPPKPRPAPLYSAKALSEALPEDAWQTVSWREGTKGVLSKQFVALRAHRATGNPTATRPSQSRVTTHEEGGLLAERPMPGPKGECKGYYSNLPAGTSLERLVGLAHGRWLIEPFYEDAKGECGLDHFQGRRWEGLHRHLALVMLSYSFLMRGRAPTSPSPEGGFPPRARGSRSRRYTAGSYSDSFTTWFYGTLIRTTSRPSGS